MSARANRERVHVQDGLCASCSVHVKQVHHGDFPEIRSEAGTAAEGASHLARQLGRARDGSPSAWHREAIDQAIADVLEFLQAIAAEEERGPRCRCGPREGAPREPAASGHGRAHH